MNYGMKIFIIYFGKATIINNFKYFKLININYKNIY